MTSILEVIKDASPFVTGLVASIIAAALSYYMKAIADRTRERILSVQQRLQGDLVKQMEAKDARISHLHSELARLQSQFTEDKGVVSSSLQEVDLQIDKLLSAKLTEQEDKSRTELETALRGLRERLDKIEKRFPSTETIETITNVNEAILSTKLEGLGSTIERVEKKVDDLEKSRMTQWDVAKTLFAILSVVAALSGIVFGVISLLPKGT